MHSMKVQKTYFDMIKNGTKTIEVRIDDERRRDLQIGDLIEFSETDAPNNRFVVRIIKLHRAKSFAALCKIADVKKMGFSNCHDLLSVLNTFYTATQQQTYGAVGIEVERV